MPQVSWGGFGRGRCLRATAFFLSTMSFGATPYPDSMAAIGDSSTTALFASYERSQWLNPLKEAAVVGRLLGLLFTQDKDVLSDRQLSWTTGIDSSLRVVSHARRLRVLNPQLKIFNAGQASVRIGAMLEKQVPAIDEWSRNELSGEWPDYVTLFAGANDLCADRPSEMTSSADFRQALEKIVARTLSGSDNGKLLVVPLLQLDRLRENAQARVAGKLGLGLVNNCADLWKLAPICRTLTDDFGADNQIISERLRDFNRAITATVQNARRQWGDRVRVAKSIEKRTVSQDELAIDCFHPNHQLQNSVAAETFGYSWWAKEWNAIEAPALETLRQEKRAADERLRQAVDFRR